jgi:hypothetical protein
MASPHGGLAMTARHPPLTMHAYVEPTDSRIVGPGL